MSCSCRHILIQASRAEAHEEPAAAPTGSMTVAVHAVGAAVYLIDAHAAADAGSQASPGAAEAAPGISIPTGPAAADATASVDAAAAAAAAEGGAGEVGSAGSTAVQQGGLLRMLALYLDCGLDMEMKVSVTWLW